jgi:prophage tail gpP-like protein
MVVVPPTTPASQPSPPAQPPPSAEQVRFGSKEIATLFVRDQYFTDWTGVRVEVAVTEAFPKFSFEVTENTPVPLSINSAQFIPGDVVKVFIGGTLACSGFIKERHVGFDASQHGVRLIGVGDTYDLTTSTVPLDKLGNHDGKSWSDLAQDLMAHLGIALHKIGAVDDTPFKDIQVQPGETIWQTLERYAKMRSIVMGSNATGGLLAIGDHDAESSGTLTEGVDMLSANCVLNDENVYRKIFVSGQGSGSDESSGDQQNKQLQSRNGSSTRNRFLITIADISDTLHGVSRRADMEKLFTEGSYLEAQITVQGWYKDSNQSELPWRAGEFYDVTSPSLMLAGQRLGCRTCTYAQDASGTTTTLTMVLPEHLNGLWSYRQGTIDYYKKKYGTEPSPSVSDAPSDKQDRRNE